MMPVPQPVTCLKYGAMTATSGPDDEITRPEAQKSSKYLNVNVSPLI